MNRRTLFPFVSCLLASSWCHAEWARDLWTGCSVEVPYQRHDVIMKWSGECKNGLATGEGNISGSYGTRIEGEFREGRPFNADGRFMRVNENGVQEMARITYKRGHARIEPLVDMPNRTRIDIAPIQGSWDWKTLDGKCAEKQEYRSKGTSSIHRGDVNTRRIVELFTVDGASGWMEMLSTPDKPGEGPDCGWRERDAPSRMVSAYLRIDDEGKLWRCAAPDPATCDAVAARSAPDPAPSKERHLITSRAGGINTANPARGSGSGTGSSTARNEIEQVFDRNKGALYALYGRALRDDPKLQGKLVVELDIDVAGKVTACRVKSSELNNPELERKMCARISLFQFGPRDAPVTVAKPIDFFPAA